MLQRFHKVYDQGKQVYRAVAGSALKTDAGEDECKKFVREWVSPWIADIRLLVKDTQWERTKLNEPVAQDRPTADYESIYKYVDGKNNWLEHIRIEHEIED